jgi:hypothetical protein
MTPSQVSSENQPEGVAYTYHKLGEYQRYQFSWTPRFLPCRDHQFQSERQRCAIQVLLESAYAAKIQSLRQ